MRLCCARGGVACGVWLTLSKMTANAPCTSESFFSSSICLNVVYRATRAHERRRRQGGVQQCR